MYAASKLWSGPVPPVPATEAKLVPNPFGKLDGYTFRCPAQSPRGLWGPFTGQGGCLGDYMPENRTMRWFDCSIAADDGDTVLVELDDKFLADLVKANEDNADFIRKYGSNPAKLATKVLRHYRGQHYMCEQKHACPLGDNTILGVCTYALIDGKPAYGSGPDDDGFGKLAPSLATSEINIGEASGSVDSTRIDLNAATELFVSHDAGPIVESNSSSLPFAADIETVAVELDNATDTVQVIVSGKVEIEQTAGGSPFDRVLLAAAATYDPPDQPYETAESFSTEEEGVFNFSLVGSFGTLSNQTGDYQFGLRLGIFPGGSGITVEATFTDINVVVGVFKR